MIKVHVSSPLLLNCIQSLLKSTLGFWLAHKSMLFRSTCDQLHAQWRDYPGLTCCSFFFAVSFFFASCNFSSEGLKPQLWGNLQQYFLCIWQGSLLSAKGQLHRPDLIVWQILYQLARSGESQINPVWKSESPILCFSHVINTSTVCAHIIQINCLLPASCYLLVLQHLKVPSHLHHRPIYSYFWETICGLSHYWVTAHVAIYFLLEQ